MSELSDKIALRRELSRHLRELSLLLGRPVHKDELLSLDETRRVRARANEIERQPLVRFAIPFEEKGEAVFAAFVERLANANSSDVYLWTPASNICGVLRPIPLRTVRLAFPFNLNPEGIVVILTSDLADQLLLDYSTEVDEQLLQVEVSGKHWGGVTY